MTNPYAATSPCPLLCANHITNPSTGTLTASSRSFKSRVRINSAVAKVAPRK
ncbi:hypothetical protein [Nonomuraea sp. NEAU-A123]|uniref:hypothetical protein n=1 Tax=Nonomuraea sp. NEAU-A123 TaxID=2839649 RepID=UPI001BE47E11|nr:hypothetical protein [Nonomuraea sp. NEAU-A123]MBT2235811.1 hypothetical protein [Nonomuraea sp. NEAU-A123]